MIREPLQHFAEQMEGRLVAKDENRGPRGWLDYHPLWLLLRAEEELKELKEELMRPSSLQRVVQEAADVANFCMMIADVMQAQIRPGKRKLRREEDDL